MGNMPEVKEQQVDGVKDQQVDGKENDINYWKKEAREAFEVRDAQRKTLREVQQELETFRQSKAQIEKEKAEALEQERKAKLEQEGKYKEALTLTEQKAEERVKMLSSAFNKRMLPLAIKDAAKGINNLTKEALDDLPLLLERNISIDPETMEAFPIDEQGKRMVDEKLQPIPLDRYITDFVSKRSYMLTSSTPSKHGIGAGKGTPMTYEEALANPELMKQWMEVDMTGFMAAQKAHFQPGAIAARSKKARQSNSQ